MLSIDGGTGEVFLGEVPVAPSPVVEYFEGTADPTAADASDLLKRGPPDHGPRRRAAAAAGAGERRHRRGRGAGAAVRGAGHRPVPHRAHVPRRPPGDGRAPGAGDDRRGARGGPGRAAAAAAGRLHRDLHGDGRARPSRSGCSTRRCTSSCRTSPISRSRSPWSTTTASTSTRTRSCSRRCAGCTRRTRCSGCAACGWASRSRGCSGCRSGRSPRRPPRSAGAGSRCGRRS